MRKIGEALSQVRKPLSVVLPLLGEILACTRLMRAYLPLHVRVTYYQLSYRSSGLGRSNQLRTLSSLSILACDVKA